MDQGTVQNPPLLERVGSLEVDVRVSCDRCAERYNEMRDRVERLERALFGHTFTGPEVAPASPYHPSPVPRY